MITTAFLTNTGSRPVNEDACGVFEQGGMTGAIVCDGLGGHGMGEVASELVKDVFGDRFAKMSDIKTFLPQAFAAGQDVLMAEQAVRHAPSRMKTTAAALVIKGHRVFIAHIGDSRVYVFRKGRVKRRTIDHSIPQMMVLSKELKESEIRHHPQRNIVLRGLGVPWEKNMTEEMKPFFLRKDMSFLLCSDGFWELCEEAEMEACLAASATPQEWLMRMTEIIRKNGAGTDMDNYTAVAVWNR